ncbi:hypothetical protein BaRGS_00002596 [Batillaria attramentaria]|uniref:Uncharacterized protein n=1 Tax=Batillaria attramentaria TaxID=370345 RepID=A0ABD0M531_9CAEN
MSVSDSSPNTWRVKGSTRKTKSGIPVTFHQQNTADRESETDPLSTSCMNALRITIYTFFLQTSNQKKSATDRQGAAVWRGWGVGHSIEHAYDTS